MHSAKSAGYSWVYAKCTQGDYDTQTTYAVKKAAARSAGLMFGAYHFFDWTIDAVAQAKVFLNSANIVSGDLVPMVDFEADDNGVAGGLNVQECVAAIDLCLSTVTKAIGRFPLVYTYPAFWKEFLGGTTGFTGHPLWISAPGYSSPPNLGIWKPAIWQYNSAGIVGNIPGFVDQDWFLGDRAALESFVFK